MSYKSSRLPTADVLFDDFSFKSNSVIMMKLLIFTYEVEPNASWPSLTIYR